MTGRVKRAVSVMCIAAVLFFMIRPAAAVRAEETSAGEGESGSEIEAIAAETIAPTPTPEPALTNLIAGWPQMGEINEESGYLIDADNLGVLYSLNADATRYPASITKILTALLTIENCSLSDTLTMTSTGTQMAVSGSTNAATLSGEQFTIEEALSMLLLKSANDIANQLAEHVAGSMDEFVRMMNERAAALGCEGTHFNNPSGMPDSEHYTTPHDMALIMRECIRNETFVRIAGASSCTIPATNMTPDDRVYVNHNKLVVKDSEYYYEYCIAGKTGYTDAAWRTYIAAAQKDGRTLICVLMRGPDKHDFTDAAALFEYGFNQFSKIDVEGGSVNLPEGVSTEDLTWEADEEENGKRRIRYYYNKLPVGGGEVSETVYESMREKLESGSSADSEAASKDVKKSMKKGDVRALIVVLAVILLVLGAGFVYTVRREQQRKRRRRRRR